MQLWREVHTRQPGCDFSRKLEPMEPQAQGQGADGAMEPRAKQLDEVGRDLAAAVDGRTFLTGPGRGQSFISEARSKATGLPGGQEHPVQHAHEARGELKVSARLDRLRGHAEKTLSDTVARGLAAHVGPLAELPDNEFAASAFGGAVLVFCHVPEDPVTCPGKKVAVSTHGLRYASTAAVGSSIAITRRDQLCDQSQRCHGHLVLRPCEGPQRGFQQPVSDRWLHNPPGALSDQQLRPAETLQQHSRTALPDSTAIAHDVQHRLHDGLDRQIITQTFRRTSQMRICRFCPLPDLALDIVQAMQRPLEQHGDQLLQAARRPAADTSAPDGA
mmetsp:Transcript_18130/g.51731  ORF Transcript_18130/g.51731 Transcript_18130/m.51731 type:complete len:331 (-) Transcript_18130:1247-2239(-)